MSTLEQRVIDLGKQRDQFEREAKAWRERAESRLKEIEALEVHVERLDAFLKFVIGASFEGCDTDGASAQDKALELGLLREEVYDKEIHGDDPKSFYEVQEGETLLFYTQQAQSNLAERDSGAAESDRTDLMKSTTACDDQFIGESGKDGE